MTTRRDFLKAVAATPFVGPTGLASDNTSARDELRKLCTEGLKARSGRTGTSHEDELIRAANERLNHELGVIHGLRLSEFFLVLADIHRLATKNKLRPTVVGPAAGSLVMYALGLSAVCPLRHGLLFDRFLDREQTTAPSITLLVHGEGAEHLIQSVRHCRRQCGPAATWPQHRAFSTGWSRDGGRPDDATVDILSYLGLSVVRQTLELVHQSGKSNLDLEGIPEDDLPTLALFRRGDTEDIFQFQSSGMQDFLRTVQPASLADLAATIALYRPGPIREGVAEAFATGSKSSLELRYRHPELESAIEDTRGVLVYDEQIMAILHQLGGLGLGEGFSLIKAVRKWRHKTTSLYRARFCSGARRRGLAHGDATAIFDELADASKQTFCKAHATVYARLAYDMAFPKVHFPDEFEQTNRAVSMKGQRPESF